ncbi:hypothetical protein SAMN06265348_103294 [Pedobacter westerhofensis]|uniref:Uncharacterized protein n=1 Tax=Pedobacter westerhofensis TaxID=425512 RepID=A0A521C7Q0_9SPHI|nr:hypothetical protein [Pedobacter westerhofensis]SMO55512.1 hypothetical protein SAMN06265348_103294 [Pedobacter westerhofensis]
MKKIFFTLLSLGSACSLYAQSNIFEQGSNVGIGTTNPSGKLEILGQSNGDQLIISRNVLAGAQGPGITFRNIVNSGTLETIGGLESQLRSGSTSAIAGSLSLFTINNSSKINAMSIASNGNIGIGTATPSSVLEVMSQTNGDQVIISRNVLSAAAGPGITFKNLVNNGTFEKIGGIESQLKSGTDGAIAGALSLFTMNNSIKIDAVSVASNGDVGIGTANTRGYKLAVNGNIRSKEIKVEMDNWPDYVFRPNYQMRSLAALKHYIGHHKHLPDLPSAEDVSNNGLNIGEIIKAQTKMIEEVTLYLIEKDQQFDSLRKDNVKQQKEINLLKSQLSNKFLKH